MVVGNRKAEELCVGVAEEHACSVLASVEESRECPQSDAIATANGLLYNDAAEWNPQDVALHEVGPSER